MQKQQQNKSAQIRQGLLQFVASLMENLEGNPQAVAQLITASLLEEAMKISTKDNKNVDFFVAKPILKASSNLINLRGQELKEQSKVESDTMIKELLLKQSTRHIEMSKIINSIVDSIPTPKGAVI